MAKFRNVSSEALVVADVGRNVEPDALLDVPGDVKEELEDAYIVSSELGERAWPKALWSNVTTGSEG